MFIKVPFWRQILAKFSKPEIYPEAFFAYFHRLPHELKVSWFREDGMIVGKVEAGGKEFMTQGANVDDFIRMVNESLITVFNVPEDYIDAVKQTRTYCPDPSQLKLLQDKSISRSIIGLVKSDRSLKLV